MLNLEKANEPKSYEFSWELIGYDCSRKVQQSPRFKVSFQVTEWYMELDLRKLENIHSCIPFRLQRLPDIGPTEVTLDVKITVKLSGNEGFFREISQFARVFNEKRDNHWEFNIDIPSLKSENYKWLTSKSIIINVEMKTPVKTDPVFPNMYWFNQNSLKGVLEGLKTLLSDGSHHDLLVKEPEKEFKLHKCVLNARWPCLMSRLNIGESKVVEEPKEFSGVPDVMLQHLFEFAYFGNLDFMYQFDKIEDGLEFFKVVKELNFYRLNDQITHLSPKCSSSQILQSYRTSVKMMFTNVTSTEMAMGDFRTCDIPLKRREVEDKPQKGEAEPQKGEAEPQKGEAEPQKVETPKSDKTLSAREREKIEQHIGFMDLKVYVNKGKFGYNWLMFSVVLGKLPKKGSVAQCKLYVVREDDKMHLLTEQHLVFSKSKDCVVSFETTFKPGKTCERYLQVSEPVITWRELIDEQKGFLRKREVTDVLSGKTVKENDIFFRFEIKLADGECLHDTRHGGECELELQGDYKIFNDLESMSSDESFTDIEVTADKRAIKAHKAILEARSPVLRGVLKNKPNLKSLPINIKPEDLHIFIHYLYTGQLHELPVDKIEDFRSVATQYGMECLKSLLDDHDRKIETVVVS